MPVELIYHADGACSLDLLDKHVFFVKRIDMN